MPGSYWGPSSYNYLPRQIAEQRGAWADPHVHPLHARRPVHRRARRALPGMAQDGLEHRVQQVVDAFQDQGQEAGLATARRLGLVSGASLYLSLRAATEEQLSVRLAEIRAQLARSGSPELRSQAAFVEARREEVRTAIGKGHTPPQAVVDKPEVPRREVPRWIPIAGLALAVVALLRSGGK